MHYTYVLFSRADGRLYTGTTGDLRVRLNHHSAGRVRSTAYRRPLQLIYFEACPAADDAYRRERFLKSGKGGRYLKRRLAGSLPDLRGTELERP